MKYGIVLDEVFTRHAPPPGHPERPDRIRSLLEVIAGWERASQLESVAPITLDEKWLRRVHTRDHLQRIRNTAGKSSIQLDPDSHASSDSFEVVLSAAGSVVRLIDLLVAGTIDTGFVLARPPGHHACPDRAMGFCLLNHVAIGAEYALQALGLRRVAIVDFDVHHGNGTQEVFYGRSDVLYISQHQYPFYPGTGHFQEVGEGAGRGFTVNFPIRAGAGNYFYSSLFRDFVVPIVSQYRPQLVLVSAGYDAHRDDPLGGMDLDGRGFGELVNLLNRAAREVCAGKILYVLEGGYDLAALGESVLRTISTTLEPETFQIEKDQESGYGEYREQMKAHFSQRWEL